MRALDNLDAMVRDGASLRDPAGYVFEYRGGIYRRLTGIAARNWRSFEATSCSQRLMSDGVVVRTREAVELGIDRCVVMDAAGTSATDDGGVVLLHERVPVISYAQEWCFSMLRDAARLHLDLMTTLLPLGWGLKDAHPSNVQWLNGKLCLIDVASIEPWKPGPWRAYGQFCRTMLFPLLVSAYGALPLQPLLKGYGVPGVDATSAARLLRGRASFKPGVLTHVHLQSWLQGLADRNNGRDIAGKFNTSVSTSAVLRMIAGMRDLVDRLPTPGGTNWVDYRFSCTYREDELRRKSATLHEWCASHMKGTDLVVDVGCNTGEFSEIMAQNAGQVVSIDADMSCVDALYRSAVPRVLPLVVDALAPTPSAGWALSEQRSFPMRVKAGWSVWLAVIHHFVIGSGIRMNDVVAGMVSTSPFLIVEFVAPNDEMVRILMAARGVDRPDYSEEHFLAVLHAHKVSILDRRAVTPTRTLYLLQRSV